jgi:predicted transglutaminase-like cysteine proteinase
MIFFVSCWLFMLRLAFKHIQIKCVLKELSLFCVLCVLAFFHIGVSASNTGQNAFFNLALNQYITHTSNQAAVKRLHQWQRLIVNGIGKSEWQRLHTVNKFANQVITFESDITHWNKNDYWATPLEVLTTGKGDCEDYVILKYMTLVALGVDESKLRVMYVRAKSVDQPHMVLTYYKTPSQPPVVLDNIVSEIVPAVQRTDLKPIYSFNAKGLWLAQVKGQAKKVANSIGVRQWHLLLKRIEQGE